MAKKGKLRLRCLSCDAGMKARDVACRRCGSRRPGGLAETRTAAKVLFVPADGSRPFLVKAARPVCGRCGSSSRAGAVHCTSCGLALHLRVVKSTPEETRKQIFLAKARADYRPEHREALWREAHPEIYGNGGRPA